MASVAEDLRMVSARPSFLILQPEDGCFLNFHACVKKSDDLFGLIGFTAIMIVKIILGKKKGCPFETASSDGVQTC